MPTFDTPEPVFALIELAYGDIRINASDRTDTVVEIQPADEHNPADTQAAEQTQVEYANGRLLVRAPRNHSTLWGSIDMLVESPKSWARSLLGWGGGVNVTIHLPAGSRVEATSSSSFRCHGRLGEVKLTTSYGDIRIEEAARVQLKTSSGDISVTRAAGNAEVTTANGNIRIGRIDGTAAVKTSNGDLTLNEVTGDLRLNTAYGDITVDRALSGVAAKTAYGKVRVDEVVRGSVVLETSGGDLELGIREGSAAWLDVSSQYGVVDVTLDPSDAPVEAEHTVEVRAHTSYGDIHIRRA